MIVVNMPGGGVQYVAETDLLWLRRAFDSEWKGAVMLRLGSERIYSVESVEELKKKFSQAGVSLAEFAPPDARFKLIVSAKKVRQVEPGNPEIYHEKAKAVLVFSNKIKLAVRETVEDAQKKLENAG